MTTKTFQRYENKYLLNQNQYDALTKILSTYMTPDENNENGNSYFIYNIYYDTKNNDIIRNSCSKPYYKEKLRLRSYGLSNSKKDKVFLEIKKKIGGIVSKRRATMTLSEANRFISFGIRPESNNYLNNQVIDEISQFLDMYDVSKKVFISYERMAFFGNNDKAFRITFDSNIRTRRNNLSLDLGSNGNLILKENSYLMEIKINDAIPLWLARILSEEKIYHTSFSKYGAEYEKYCTKNNQNISMPERWNSYA